MEEKCEQINWLQFERELVDDGYLEEVLELEEEDDDIQSL